MSITFITGPVRSGKSTYALSLARQYQGHRVFIATGQPLDDDMAARIARHRDERGEGFITVEEPFDLKTAVLHNASAAVTVVDCLTLWVSNWLTQRSEDAFEETEKAFIGFLMDLVPHPRPLILVSNEVGWGGVPMDPLARRFADLLGLLHQHVAAVADRCILMVAGYPVVFKGQPI